jgi:tRNA-dihydrouridine synthase
MEYYFAPMEGVTTHIFRRIHASMFPGCGIYYAPFLVACQGRGFKARELMCLSPENNPGVVLVPQLLSSDPEAFLASARQLADMGFGEVDLNLGCPSGTVVSKHRGSGMLAAPDELDRFLDAVFSGARTAISVKTRLGLASADEFAKILEIYNRYPISKLIVHPRVRGIFTTENPTWPRSGLHMRAAGRLYAITATFSAAPALTGSYQNFLSWRPSCWAGAVLPIPRLYAYSPAAIPCARTSCVNSTTRCLRRTEPSIQGTRMFCSG